jgi:hypothetical protein
MLWTPSSRLQRNDEALLPALLCDKPIDINNRGHVGRPFGHDEYPCCNAEA